MWKRRLPNQAPDPHRRGIFPARAYTVPVFRFLVPTHRAPGSVQNSPGMEIQFCTGLNLGGKTLLHSQLTFPKEDPGCRHPGEKRGRSSLAAGPPLTRDGSGNRNRAPLTLEKRKLRNYSDELATANWGRITLKYLPNSPGLLIAMGADPEAYRENNGYIISEQGKPPDFVLEIASRSTGRQDTVEKRPAYAGLGIPEYWRFDETGEFHGTRLAGDRLVDGGYEPIAIETVGEGVLQGFSSVLNLLIRWDHGQLGWHDPETARHIPTLAQERAHADIEQEARMAAEAQVRELEWHRQG